MLPRSKRTITTAIIHCSATPNGRYHTVDDIDQWHGEGEHPFQRDELLSKRHQAHLQHVGYHYVIRTDGVLECGRSLCEVGAHARGYNHTSIGICLIGTDKFTPAQWTTLESLILTLKQSLPRLTKVIGHNNVSKHKPCPCFDVRAWFGNNFLVLPEHILKSS